MPLAATPKLFCSFIFVFNCSPLLPTLDSIQFAFGLRYKLRAGANTARCEPVVSHEYSRQLTTDEIINETLAGNVTSGFQQIVNGFDADLAYARETVSKLSSAVARADSDADADPIEKHALEQSLVSAKARLELLEQLTDLIDHGRDSRGNTAEWFRAVLDATTNVSGVAINRTAELMKINVELKLLEAKLARAQNAVANGDEIECSSPEKIAATESAIAALKDQKKVVLEAPMPDTGPDNEAIDKANGLLDLRRYIIGGNELVVVQRTQCAPGSYVSTPSDGSTNQKCSLCAENTFTSMANQLSCRPWTGKPSQLSILCFFCIITPGLGYPVLRRRLT